MEDPLPDLAAYLESEGLVVRRWWRRAVGGRSATPWPPEGRCGTVALRLPRVKDELEMLVHAAAARLVPEGRLLVYGANDEGAGSAAGRIGTVFRTVRSVASGGRCRLLLAEDPEPGVVRGDLAEWSRTFDPGLPELPARWASFPGVFADGRVDGGTALLLRHLPVVASGATVLDFGCGHGILGAVVAARAADASVDYLDTDALALEAVRRNVPDARTLLGDGWSAASGGPWDVLVSNPPYHRGKAESLEVLRELVRGARAHLVASGWMALVAQRRLGVGELLEGAFREVDVLGDEGPWRAWRGAGPRRA